MFMLRKSRFAGGIAGVLALAVACGGSGDRAGGRGIAEPVVLTLAQGNDEPPEQLVSWAEEVARRSDGSLQIEFANLWRNGETDAEIGTIGDVRDGEVDLAWVGARAFDRAGLLSFQPLLAPLLVDSHDLQKAVFDAGIPAEMLDSLDELGLEGIGILPGPMRKVLGIAHPFVAPADFAGQVVGIGTSDLAAHTMEALGATPQDLPTGASLDGLDGMDQQLASILGNNYALRGARFVSINVNLWPRPLVVLMNAERFGALTDDQQTILRETIETTVDDALADSRAEDADAVTALCQQGLTFSVATADDLSALREAVAPVYDQIAVEDATREWLEQITEIKEQVGAAPDTATCPETDSATDTDGFPTGTFETIITAEDYASLPEFDPDEEGTTTMVVDGNMLTLFTPGGDVGFAGTYTVFRDQIEVTSPDDTVSANWSFDGQQLVFTNVTPDQSPFEVTWESHPWQLVESAEASSTTESPAAATDAGDTVDLEGTYTWTITDEDAIALGRESETEWLPCSWTMTLDGGEWRLSEDCPENVYGGTYDVFRDRVAFTWFDGMELAFTFTVDDAGNVTLTPEAGTPDGDAFVWSSQVWERVSD